MSVYFITCRAVNMVKIGFANGPHHVRQRLTGIRVCCPLDVALELTLPGGRDKEKALHILLADHRVRGEWFWITDAIERLIASPPEADADLERPFADMDPHERLERIEAEKWRIRRGSESIVQRSREERRKRLLRELAELDREDQTLKGKVIRLRSAAA